MAVATKLSVTLTAEMVRDLEASVSAGEFASTSEALRDAVRLWLDRREERAARLAAIRARIDMSIDDPRPNWPIEEVRTRLKQTREQRLKGLMTDEAA